MLQKAQQTPAAVTGTSEGQTLAESYAYAAALTRTSARNFYYAFRLLPAQRRRSIFAVYAFSRRADDAVDAVEDSGTTPERARRDLDFLRSLLSEKPPADPLGPALRDTVDRYRIAQEPFLDLLRGMEMDMDRTCYATIEDLLLYCYRVASAIGLISVEIFGVRGPQAREPAVKLGYAMQLTNILRDVDEDLRRDRVYLPLEDMERFSYSRADLERRIADDRFRGLMDFEARRARQYFQEAAALFPMVQAESRHCPVLLMRFYSRILDRMERSGYDVFRRRPALPLHEKLWLAASTWIEARRARRAGSSG